MWDISPLTRQWSRDLWTEITLVLSDDWSWVLKCDSNMVKPWEANHGVRFKY